jgi:hypothetical protein
MAEQLIVFVGRRWNVGVDPRAKETLVPRAHGGMSPAFGGEGLPPHDEVIAEMHRVCESIAVTWLLDASALKARETFDRVGVCNASVRPKEYNLPVLRWDGDRTRIAPNIQSALSYRTSGILPRRWFSHRLDSSVVPVPSVFTGASSVATSAFIAVGGIHSPKANTTASQDRAWRSQPMTPSGSPTDAETGRRWPHPTIGNSGPSLAGVPRPTTSDISHDGIADCVSEDPKTDIRCAYVKKDPSFG